MSEGERVRLRIDVVISYTYASEILKDIINNAKENKAIIYTLMIGEEWKKKPPRKRGR